MQAKKVTLENERYGCYDVVVNKMCIGSFHWNSSKDKNEDKPYVLALKLVGIKSSIAVKNQEEAIAVTARAILLSVSNQIDL